MNRSVGYMYMITAIELKRMITIVPAVSALGLLVCQIAAAQQTPSASAAAGEQTHTSLLAGAAQSQSAQPGGASATPAADGCQPLNWTAEQDHQNMMDQLGI